jgi:CBS domain containing-hemolysin-like protein
MRPLSSQEQERRRGFVPRQLAVVALLLAFGADTCFAAGEFVDKAANFLALFIIFVMPIGFIALFWMVHVLPEKIAAKRHHPQKEAIHVLCLLSLVFGGLLWPLAWLWAFTKPVLHQMAYGRDRNDEFYAREGTAAGSGGAAGGAEPSAAVLRAEIAELNRKLAAIETRAGSTNAAGGG